MVEDFEEIFWKKKITDKETHKKNILVHIKRKLLAYFVASRFPTVTITTAFLLLGEWYAIKQILFYETILMIIFLILAELVNGLSNDFFDKKLDIFARKHTVWVYKYISAEEMLLTAIICSIVSLFILWYYFNLTIFVIGLILIIITFIYSAPPIRLKTKPPIDIISNMLLFGSLPFILGWLVSGNELNLNILVSGVIVGISAISYTLILSWNDIKTDAEFGIKTTFVRLNHDWTINVSIILWIILLIFSVIIFYFNIITISFIIVFPILIFLWQRYQKTTDYKSRQKIIKFFLWASTLLWLSFTYLSLTVLTKSLIPLVFLIIELVILSYEIFNMLISKKNHYHK